MYKKVKEARVVLKHLVMFVTLFALSGILLTQDSSAATQPAFGSHFHCTWSSYTDQERIDTLDKFAAANINWVRIDMGWSSFQETSKEQYSQWYIDRTDFCVDQANARGIKVLGVVHRTPGWANDNQGTNVPPNNPQDYGDFMNWAASRYNGRVSAWEIWNEPDPSQNFWLGTSVEYVDLLKTAYPGVKGGDPNAKVVLGGPSTNDDSWIREVYQAGAKEYFDVMATHPYQAIADKEPEYNPGDGKHWWFTSFPMVHNVMQEFNDGAKEVWFTEFGWSSHENTGDEPNWMRGVTLEQQADYAIRAIQYAEANYPNVTNMFWYTARNRDSGNIQHDNFGILNIDLTIKPIYTALSTFLSGNSAPVAGYEYTTNNLSASFTDTSTDSDGTISSWQWDFGDGSGTSIEQNPSYTYSTGGTFTVILTVTDNEGASNSISRTVSVADSTTDFSLSTNAYKVKGVQHVDLSWSGTDATNVDIFRNGNLIKTKVNDGSYTDNTGSRGSGTYEYQVCAEGADICSNVSKAVF